MAEARSIAAFRDGFTRNSQIRLFYSSETGVELTILIPPPRVVRTNAARFFYRNFARFKRLFYPLTLQAVLLFLVCFVAFIVVQPRESWWRSGAPAELTWSVCHYLFPYFAHYPLLVRICLCALVAGLFCAVVLAMVERYTLRILLAWHGWLHLEHGQGSVIVKAWGLLVKLLSRGPRSTYSFAGALPRLPVPRLAATVERYLASIKPLQTAEEFEKTKAMAHHFLHAEGPRLQVYLALKSWWAPNYVSDWWERFVYLRSRQPLMIHSNYYGLDSAFVCPTTSQIARAATWINQLMRFKRLLDREQLPPMFVKNIVPLDMTQYKRMFSTCRQPGRETDTLRHWDTADSRHIIVRYRGRTYSLPLYYKEHILTVGQIEDQLDAIVAAAAKAPAISEDDQRVPALTAWNRTRWAEVREECMSEGVNKRTLDEVESAMFHVCLDDAEPKTWTEKGHLGLHGCGWDRWFDKSVTLIVFANGQAAFNAEHSWADALVLAHVWEWCSTGEIYDMPPYRADGRNARSDVDAALPKLGQLSTELHWDLNASARESIETAVAANKTVIADVDLQVVSHDAFGKGFIKKCGLSPDAFVQMVLQLAYFRDSGRTALSYEACSMRLYLQGRTETVRPVSAASVAFVETMCNGKATKQQKAEALRAGIEHHVEAFRDAMDGKGVDRHLFALYVVSVGRSIESPFLAEAVSQPWTLSTSQQPQQQTTRWDPSRNAADEQRISPGGGFGAVVQDGYGVSYMLAGERKVFFHVSSFVSSPVTDSKRFADHIMRAFADMRAVLE